MVLKSTAGQPYHILLAMPTSLASGLPVSDIAVKVDMKLLFLATEVHGSDIIPRTQIMDTCADLHRPFNSIPLKILLQTVRLNQNPYRGYKIWTPSE